MNTNVVVVGQLARDLVLSVDRVPGAGESGQVQLRREMLGGEGANQAVALAQLGMRPALVAVAGDDGTGRRLLEQAERDGVDVSAVIRREGTRTGLIVDVVDPRGRWRYLEDLPPAVLLTKTDVTAAGGVFARAGWVSVQLRQPRAAVLAAARLGRQAGATVVLDGAPPDGRHNADLLRLAGVVRADAGEAGLPAGGEITDVDGARRAAADILGRGPGLVAIAVGDVGNYFAWEGGESLLPPTRTPVADATGAGGAFTAALIAALARGDGPERAARLAVAAAGATVGHPGGRPALSTRTLDRQLALLDGQLAAAAQPG
jgi:ribokinase